MILRKAVCENGCCVTYTVIDGGLFEQMTMKTDPRWVCAKYLLDMRMRLRYLRAPGRAPITMTVQ